MIFAFLAFIAVAIAVFYAVNSNIGRHKVYLVEVLEAGFVHIDAGTRDEVYVWPYFTHVPLEALSPQQMVELFTIVTAYDFDEMKQFGAYNFYRAGIAPAGPWVYFVAGD